MNKQPIPHLLVLLATAVASPLACGDLLFSSVHNIAIPATMDGVYLDFTDPDNPDAVTTGTTVPLTWDLNPMFGGGAVGNSDTFQLVTDTTANNADLLRLAYGATVGAASNFPANFSGSIGHMGADPDQFANGQTGYIGFRLQSGSFSPASPTGPLYGFMSVTLRNDGSAGSVNWWAWDNTGAAVTIAIPEPGSLGLSALLLGTVLLQRRRR